MHRNETSFQFLTLQESTQNVLNTDMKYLKLLISEKTQGKFFRTLQWTMFFFKASKRTGNKNKYRQIIYIKWKRVFIKKKHSIECKDRLQNRKILVMHTSEKELIFKIQEGFQKLNIKIKKITQLKLSIKSKQMCLRMNANDH